VRFSYVVVAALFFALSPHTQAEQPLTIEKLLPASKRWRIELGAVYATSDTTGVETQFEIIQTGPTQFISIPTLMSEARRNSDIVVFTGGVRYGVTAETELFGRVSGLIENTRSTFLGESRTQRSERFADSRIGVNHLFVQEGKTPALLGFAEVALIENTALTGHDIAYGKSWLFGFTIYRTIDPVVLSATASYHVSIERRVNGQDQNPGDFLLVSPSVAFAVNNEITLAGGFQWRRKQADKINGSARGISTTAFDFSPGLAYIWSKRLTLFLDTRLNISGDSGVQVGLTGLYKLGK